MDGSIKFIVYTGCKWATYYAKGKERKTEETKYRTRQAAESTDDATKQRYQLKPHGTYFCRKLDLKPVVLKGR